MGLALQVVLFCQNLFEKCLIICQHCLIMCRIVMINVHGFSDRTTGSFLSKSLWKLPNIMSACLIMCHWCHGIMGKGWWMNLPPWLPSKQIPHHVSKLTHKWNKSMILSQLFTNMYICCWVGPWFRNHGWGLMGQSTRRARTLALQVVPFCPNLFENCLIICQHFLLMPNNVMSAN